MNDNKIVIRCKKCGNINSEGFEFCSQCGNAIKTKDIRKNGKLELYILIAFSIVDFILMIVTKVCVVHINNGSNGLAGISELPYTFAYGLTLLNSFFYLLS